MPTVYTTIKAHLHNPEPGSTTVKRLEHADGSFIILDFTGGEVGTPDVSAFFPTYDHALAWVDSLRRAICTAVAGEVLMLAEEHLAQEVTDEIGAPV